MNKITTISELRDDAIETLERLRVGKIDVHEAGVTGKLYETVISSIKTQLLYAEMMGTDARIPFMGGEKIAKVKRLDKPEVKKLGKSKK